MSHGKEQEIKHFMECIELYRELPTIWRINSDYYSNRMRERERERERKKRFANATKEDVIFLLILFGPTSERN